MSVSREFSYYFSSDTNTGAFNISPDGSSFNVAVPGGIRVPRDSLLCDIGVYASTIWNDSNNIAAAFGNNTFVYTTLGPNPGTYTITIPDGLYSLENLQSFLSITFTNNGQSSGLFTLTGDNATSKVYITFALAGDTFEANASGVSSVLGFETMGSIVSPTANWSILGNNTAAFNRVNSYIVTSDMVTSGIPINNNSAQALCQVPITVAPGSQINFFPSIILWTDGSHLIGQNRANFTFSLRDQSLRPATTKEIWSVTVIIRYIVPVIDGAAARIR